MNPQRVLRAVLDLRTAQVRAGDGMRPRTALVLFNSLVRPILEYCAVLWEGSVSAGLSREVERVQTAFLRAVSGVHRQGMGCLERFSSG